MMFAQPQAARSGLAAALDGVSARVRRACELSHERLADLGVPHVLVGDLAVGVHGHQCAAQSVAWLVERDGAFEVSGSDLIAFRPGVPVKVHSVGITYATTEGPPSVVEAMAAALATSAASPRVVVVAPAELVVWMRLRAGRSADVAAVVELLKAGQLDQDAVRTFVGAAGDAEVIERFAAAVQTAIEEG